MAANYFCWRIWSCVFKEHKGERITIRCEIGDGMGYDYVPAGVTDCFDDTERGIRVEIFRLLLRRLLKANQVG